MNDRLKKLAEKAGFEFWGEEPWRPKNQMIDWSSDYDNELDKFSKLIIQDVAKWLKANSIGGEIQSIELLKAYDVKPKDVCN